MKNDARIGIAGGNLILKERSEAPPDTVANYLLKSSYPVQRRDVPTL